MKFNEKIIRLRKNKGMTQDELASAVGVSRQAVYKWESAQSYPEVTKLIELKLLFDVSIDDLLDDSFDVAAPEKKKRKKVQKPKVEVIEENKPIAPIVEADEAPVTAESVSETVVAEVPIAVSEKTETVTVEESMVAPVSQNYTAEKAEAAPVEEPVVAAPAAEEKPSAQNTETEKKVGFFGRLFGRK